MALGMVPLLKRCLWLGLAHHFIMVSACHESYGELIEDFCLSKFKSDMETLRKTLWCDWDKTLEVKKTKICSRTLSDHSPVWIEFDQEKEARRSWRLNENLFKYEQNVNECKKQMKEFFIMNMKKETSIEMIWDASKAYMRGNLIQMNIKYKNKLQKKKKELEEEIKKKEQLLINSPGNSKYERKFL
ncbi:receptor activity-modifying protein 1 isoform X2 [Ahaetulla prasina]|uniref:receptor activity-modifying protein 1 isoform X2 n=1 Tax=Ahaetulla prasina TaxID=499056 RepID=UPI0026479BDF|nr:receptor activity-modifying protein 1 isoform X2 [Ahaetulla prasina]